MSKTQRRGKVHWTQTPAGRAKLQARSARQRQAKQERVSVSDVVRRILLTHFDLLVR